MATPWFAYELFCFSSCIWCVEPDILFTLSSERYLACMQVPKSNRLFRDIQLMNKLNESNYRSMCSIGNLSHRSNHGKFLKLKWKKLERLASQVGGAKNIFCEMFGDHKANDTFWLDSSSVEKVCFLVRDTNLCWSLLWTTCIILLFQNWFQQFLGIKPMWT